MLLGIDFGTSYCSLSRINPKSGLPEAILDENDGNKIPSLVFWGKNDVKVGKAAEEIFNESQMMSVSEQLDILQRTIKSIKRNLSKEYHVYLPDGKLVSAQQIVAEIFKYLKKTAECGCSCTNIHRVSLTHPVDFSEDQKKLLKSAASIAGFSEIQLLPEPIAAAKGYLATSGVLGKNILVFDLGAGTLDLSFVHKAPHQGYHLPVLPLGKFDCGGDDFDQLLYDYLEKVYVSQGEPTFCDNVDFINLSVMLQCRMAKEKLSRNEEIRFKASVKHSAIKITREQFNKVISRKIEECTTLTKQMLRNIKNAGYQVDTVLLIGGSSRIPFLRDELEKILPVKPLQTMYADIAVALGAVAELVVKPAKQTDSIPPTIKQPTHVESNPQKEKEQQAKNKISDEANSLTEMGHRYLRGIGIKKNTVLAVEYFQNALLQKNVDAQAHLGFCYLKGLSVEKNTELGKKLLYEAFDKGNPTATAYLGEFFLEGSAGFQKDETLAFKYLNVAIEDNIIEAKNDLGICYLEGRGVQKDETMGLRLLEQSANDGNAISYANLGYWYIMNGDNEHKKLGLKYLEKAMNLNEEYAFCFMGLNYLNGLGVEKDDVKGFKYLATSARLGCSSALISLGLCYLNGHGVPQDYSRGIRYLEKAKDDDIIDAFYWLGACYWEGKGVVQNRKLAITLLSHAAKMGHVIAAETLNKLGDVCWNCHGKGVSIGNQICHVCNGIGCTTKQKPSWIS